MLSCTHVQRIRRAMIAIVALFVLGFIVFGTSMMFFDIRYKNEPIPKSMQVEAVMANSQNQPHDGKILPIFLVIFAAIGLPLGLYAIKTLTECEQKAIDHRLN
jgi:hypothetical protein